MAFDATRADALAAVTQIYAQYNHTPDSGDLADMDNRIRNGQTLAELVANTYDQAYKRFFVPDTPTTRAEEAAGVRPTYDAQLNTGIAFDVPTVMLEELSRPAREQAEQMAGRAAVSPLQRAPTNGLRYNAGPAPSAFGGGLLSGGGGLPIGMLLLLAGGGVLLFVMLRKKGRH